MPKRAGLEPDGVTLGLRRFPFDMESAPYDRAKKSHEALELMEETDIIMEQPDGGDLSDYATE
jgi:hypothetical protein